MAQLPADIRQALLLAAADESGEAQTLGSALKRCGLPESAFAAAQETGLVQADGAVVFRLFLSSRTVEYHLGKVFTKLGVASRVELARLTLDPAVARQVA